jgi:hypothetical protein
MNRADCGEVRTQWVRLQSNYPEVVRGHPARESRRAPEPKANLPVPWLSFGTNAPLA